MLEIVFSDSAAGSLTLAMDRIRPIDGATAVFIAHADGRKPKKAECRAAQRQAETRERRCWAEAVPLEGSHKDILSFPLALSVGEIDETGIGAKREAALSLLTHTYPEIGSEAASTLLETSRASLAALLARAGAGAPLRIWTSSQPDETCGLYWLLAQLQPIGLEGLDITLVALPEYETRPDGTVVQYGGWGDVEPHQWGRLAGLGKQLPTHLAKAMAAHWNTLQTENAPLRAMLNGRLVSAPETLYDSYILHELDAAGEEFMEAIVVGKVLGKYRLGIGDAWVSLRIEQFIQSGRLEPVTQPAAEGPIYHRLLRKRR